MKKIKIDTQRRGIHCQDERFCQLAEAFYVTSNYITVCFFQSLVLSHETRQLVKCFGMSGITERHKFYQVLLD